MINQIPILAFIPLCLLVNATSEGITGTSTSTSAMVTMAVGDCAAHSK